MSCEAHMCKVVELSLCANFLNTDPYTRVLKRWLVYAGCDCLTMFIFVMLGKLISFEETQLFFHRAFCTRVQSKSSNLKPHFNTPVCRK